MYDPCLRFHRDSALALRPTPSRLVTDTGENIPCLHRRNALLTRFLLIQLIKSISRVDHRHHRRIFARLGGRPISESQEVRRRGKRKAGARPATDSEEDD